MRCAQLTLIALTIACFHVWNAESFHIPDPDADEVGLPQDDQEYSTEDGQTDADEEDSGDVENGERNARQKNCEWSGCQKLPLEGKPTCKNGFYLESYKSCDPRGSKSVNSQCCREN